LQQQGFAKLCRPIMDGVNALVSILRSIARPQIAVWAALSVNIASTKTAQ
jgi:hypothetical protein